MIGSGRVRGLLQGMTADGGGTVPRLAQIAKPVIRAGLRAYRTTCGTVATLARTVAEVRAELEHESGGAKGATMPGPGAVRADERARPASGRTAAAGVERRSAPATAGPAAPEPWARVIGRFAVLLLAPMLTAGAGAYVVTEQSPRIYAAQSEIVFDVRDLSWASAERFLATQVVVARSRALLDPIAAAFDMPVRRLEEGLSVETVAQSGVLRLQYASPSAALAVEINRAITDRYLLHLRQFEQAWRGDHRLLTPTFLIEDPIAPRPLRAAAIGAVVGLAIGAAGLVLRSQAWQLT